jgi:spermidine dehydrogenase
VGSFEAAHGVRDGNFPAKGAEPKDTKEDYDLVIVGGGISGLAAAYFWRAKNPNARILILDNHDDFGGHAKRNELRADGRLLLANGGTWAIESPFAYSKVARGLPDELGLIRRAGQNAIVATFTKLWPGCVFDKQTRTDRLVAGAPRGFMGPESMQGLKGFLEKSPLAEQVRHDILRLETEAVDYFRSLVRAEKRSAFANQLQGFSLACGQTESTCHSVLPNTYARTFWRWN